MMTKQEIMITKAQKQECKAKQLDYVEVQEGEYEYKCTVKECKIKKICKHNNWEKVSDCYGCSQVIYPLCSKGIPCCECFVKECYNRVICQILQ